MLTLIAATSLVLAQQAAPQAIGVTAPQTLEEARLTACMTEARADPAQAITTASQWLVGLSGVATSAPQQCLGMAYMGLSRWDAAMIAFLAARDVRAEDDKLSRARLGAMAGNAALAGRQFLVAESVLALAGEDALAGGDRTLAGIAAADRSRALVALDDAAAAGRVLASARELAPQDAAGWLLSATLARRAGDLANASAWIGTAGVLDPENLAVGLEAGLIAALAENDTAARASWTAVIDLAPRSAEAATARAYIAQLDEMAAATP
jgi:tetratricopeptide (TPR) repeat protein